MRKNPALATAFAVLVISVQGAIAGPCRDGPIDALSQLDIAAITNRVEADPEVRCLGDRMRIAVEVVLGEITELARERALPCSARCWLDRPASAIARVDGHIDPIWPRPPPDLGNGDGDVVFIICAPDLVGGWWWVAVSPPDRAGRVDVEVRREEP